MHRRHDVIAVWRERAITVSGKALPCGHFLPEEAPEETYTALQTFLLG
jgi:haloacetate dehalogenase